MAENRKKRRRPNVLPRLFVAIVLGMVIGLCAPDCVIRATNCWRDIYWQFIRFFVPFIIIGLVTPAIADTGRDAGRVLLLTLGIAYASTLLSGFFAYFMSQTVFPLVMEPGALSKIDPKFLPAYFKMPIPPLMDVTTALFTAFMLGLGIVSVRAEVLARAASELRDVVTLTIAQVFVPLLPTYICAVIADLTASGKFAAVGGGCVKIMLLAMVVTTTIVVVQYIIAGAVAHRNPFKALWTMLPAYLIGWGCCSSAATIPYTLRQTRRNGVSYETADLVIPLCSNVHLAGSMANMVVYAAGMLVLAGETAGFGSYVEYILMISVIAVASPGVPGGVVLASAAVAETALGFTPERYAILVAVYMALDGMGTACNLTGDGAIAMIVDKLRRRPADSEES